MKDLYLFIKREFFLLSLLLMFFFDLNEKGYYICFILAFYLCCSKLLSLLASLDNFGILLVLFSIFYAVFYSYNPQSGTTYIWVYTVAPITFYAIGRYFSTKYRSFNVTYFLLVFIALGYSFIPSISIIYDIIQNGFVGERNVKLLTRSDVSSATVLGSYFTMNMAAIGTVFVPTKEKIVKKIKLIFFALFIISLFCVLRVASRTQLIIALISLVTVISYLMLKQSSKKNVRLLVMMVIPVLVVFYISPNAPYLNMLEQRNNDEEKLMSANGRTQLWETSLKNLTENPFGWKMPSNISSEISQYSHNLWLDVDRIGGIIPFIFISLFTIACISLVLKIIKITSENLFFNLIALVFFIGFMAVFFVEPIIEGMFYLFLIFCLFIGILVGYTKFGFIENSAI